MIPRLGDAPQSGIRYTARPGVYAILPIAGRVLLTAQTEPELDIQLPGGGIDPGESPLTSLHREVLEETGWTIARPRRMGAFRRFVFMPEYDLWAEKICTIYLAHPVQRLSEPTEPFHDALWVPVDEAPFILGNDGDRMFLGRYLASSHP